MTEPTPARSILVVDDEPDSLETLRLLLTEEGFAVRVASSGAEALALIAERPPDLMVVDLMMPVMTGFDLCQYVRAEKTTRDIPCIAYSGYPTRYESGAGPYDRVFLKPADFSELLRAIRELLSRRS